MILRTVAAHADSLLRTARSNSLCLDDAQDAYQRGLEIFMANAARLDPDRAAGWLHVVVKREAQAIRRSRSRHVSSSDVDYDVHEAGRLPTPEEQLLRFDLVSRSAEALQRLKPQELRALWLKAQGHSYSEIGELTGWSYTKVNRCLTEGRRSFLDRYAGIESGAECERWLPVISAMVDGEASAEQILEMRPHLRNCPGCRATLKALHDSSAPLSAVLPVPLIAAATGGSEHISNLFMRAYEAVSSGVHERAVHSVTKAQSALEAVAGGKVAAVAASAAAVAGGGYATVERTVMHERHPAPAAKVAQHKSPRTHTRVVASKHPVVSSGGISGLKARLAAPRIDEFGASHSAAASSAPTEFGATQRKASVQAIAASASHPASGAPVRRSPAAAPVKAKPAPEFGSSGASDEFGP